MPNRLSVLGARATHYGAVLRHILGLRRPANIVNYLLLSTTSFNLFQRLGIFLIPAHFYSPVPDVDQLDRPPSSSDMPGVEVNEARQELTASMLHKYHAECQFPTQPTALPWEYHTAQDMFDGTSAAAMHAFIREYRPSRVVEVGCGNSTYVIARAAEMNRSDGHRTFVQAIDPFPNDVLRAGLPGLDRLMAARVETCPLQIFTDLKENDILSIDSSHTVRLRGDVTFLYLEVLPRLAPGVLIHVHDIFLPEDYPQEWVRRRWYWTEQYLLQAFLVHNSEFEVLWAQKYVLDRLPALYREAVPNSVAGSGTYSFWMQRRPRA
jgi:hypothetical protein